MKKELLLIVFLLFQIVVKSQHNHNPDSTNKQPDALFKVAPLLLYPSIGFEYKVFDNFTANMYFMEGVSYMYVIDYNNDKPFFHFKPYLTFELRRYHHIKKRLSKNKNTNNFSADFFELSTNVYVGKNKVEFIGPLMVIHMNRLNLFHGWQRNLGRNFYYTFKLGASILYDENGFATDYIGPDLRFNIGYRLPVKLFKN